MYNYTIMGSHNDYCEIMCYDILEYENVYFENKKNFLNNQLLKLFYKIHLSKKINKIINLPFKNIWYHHYLDESKIDRSAQNIIILFDSNCHIYEEEYLNYLKEKFNAKLVLVLANPISTIKTHDISYFNSNFNIIFSIDKLDCDTYGYYYIPGIYSKIDLNELEDKKIDLFFIGKAKNRLSILHNIASLMTSEDFKFEFNIVEVTPNEMNSDLNIVYNKRIDYSTVLKKVQESNCLLEVLQQGQSGVTLRTLEAIVYNKKLLTNNLDIKKNPFYNEKYISVFTDINDIDLNFIKENNRIDYNYNNQYSPQKLIEKIEELLMQENHF